MVRALIGEPEAELPVAATTHRDADYKTAEGPELTRDRLRNGANSAIDRGDWMTANQLLTELARLLKGSDATEAEDAALAAARIADDPMKLDGVGLHGPVELLIELRPDKFAEWLNGCQQRPRWLDAIRTASTAGVPAAARILRDAGIGPWLEWLEGRGSIQIGSQGYPRRYRVGPPCG